MKRESNAIERHALKPAHVNAIKVESAEGMVFDPESLEQEIRVSNSTWRTGDCRLHRHKAMQDQGRHVQFQGNQWRVM